MSESPRIRVKFVNRGQASPDPIQWLRQFPNRKPVWGNCHFLFDPAERDYDWFVAENDLSSPPGKAQKEASEALACPPEHTLFITREPSSVTTYGTPFLRQFKHVLTGQEDWALKHPGKILSQPALRWYYGDTQRNQCKDIRDFDWIEQHPPIEKTKDIATVCSIKAQKHTMHYDRVQFVEKLCKALPQMDRFGEGFQDIPDKAASLDPYKYHIAIENHVCEHWWTEKLSDAFLGLCLPFYHGAPNADTYFPTDSFIPINIYDFADSLKIITEAIETRQYEQRIDSIRAARQLALHQYSTFAVVSELIQRLHTENKSESPTKIILGKHAIRKNPIAAIQVGIEKSWVRTQTVLRKTKHQAK